MGPLPASKVRFWQLGWSSQRVRHTVGRCPARRIGVQLPARRLDSHPRRSRAAYGRKSRPQTVRLPPQTGTLATTGYGRLRRQFPRPPTLGHAYRGGWEDPCQISRPTARFSPEAASRRETRTTHRPTSHGPLPLFFVSDRRRPCVLRYPTLRWPDRLETAPKKTIVAHFARFLAVFSAGGSPFAAAFFATRSPAARAHDVD